MRGEFHEELAKYAFSLPIMPRLQEHLKQNGNVNKQKIGWHCHLTEITAVAAEALLTAGARLIMSECNTETTNIPAVEYMRRLGAEVFLGADSCNKVLAAQPAIISDTGLVLTRTYLSSKNNSFVYAASEITTSGIMSAADIADMTLPVFDINSGALKTYIENFHGVGDGLADLLQQLTGRMWSGRRATVIGYGSVGSGVAHYLRRLGADVCVTDIDPVRQLIAHYDGYRVCSMKDALQQSELIVTATGRQKLIGREEWLSAVDGALFINVGHWSTELDLVALNTLASENRQVMPHLRQFTLSKEKHLFVIADGNPANVVVLSGSPEPTLIHLTTEILCMDHLLTLKKSGSALAAGVHNLPVEVERRAAQLALSALNLSN